MCLNKLLRFTADTEMQMNPVERVQYYTQLPNESFDGRCSHDPKSGPFVCSITCHLGVYESITLVSYLDLQMIRIYILHKF